MTASKLFIRAVEMYMRLYLPGWRISNVTPEVVAQICGETGRIGFAVRIERAK